MLVTKRLKHWMHSLDWANHTWSYIELSSNFSVATLGKSDNMHVYSDQTERFYYEHFWVSPVCLLSYNSIFKKSQKRYKLQTLVLNIYTKKTKKNSRSDDSENPQRWEISAFHISRI